MKKREKTFHSNLLASPTGYGHLLACIIVHCNQTYYNCEIVMSFYFYLLCLFQLRFSWL